MHFGQYAFGLFHQMYLDEIQNAGSPGWPPEPSVRDPREIPVAILENNVFGIDIDPRAVQIAALSLLLTAKEAALRNGCSPVDVLVKRTNLVAANSVDLGEDRLRSLVGRLGDRVGSALMRERLVKAIRENLSQAGELGSLIQVRESVAEVLDEWVQTWAREKGLLTVAGPMPAQQLELAIAPELRRQRARQVEVDRGRLADEARRLEGELISALEQAAET
jgi:hypothetical protein